MILFLVRFSSRSPLPVCMQAVRAFLTKRGKGLGQTRPPRKSESSSSSSLSPFPSNFDNKKKRTHLAIMSPVATSTMNENSTPASTPSETAPPPNVQALPSDALDFAAKVSRFLFIVKSPPLCHLYYT